MSHVPLKEARPGHVVSVAPLKEPTAGRASGLVVPPCEEPPALAG